MSKQLQYELLALALSYPHSDLISAIEQGQYAKEFGKIAPIPSSLEDLEVEYCRLFVGPGHVEVPPYESVYLGNDNNLQKGLVMGQAAIEVDKFYHAAGLQITTGFTDMPDHIAAETWFLAYLEAMTQSERESNFLAIKQQFISEHLGQWVFPFTESIKKASRHPWYTFAGDLLMEMLEIEQSSAVNKN